MPHSFTSDPASSSLQPASASARQAGSPVHQNKPPRGWFGASGVLLTALLVLSGCGAGPSVDDGKDGSIKDGSEDGTGATGSIDGKDTISIVGGLGGTKGTGTEEGDPCLSDTPPADCVLDYEPSGPGCGDGEVNVDGEECDDENGLPGDGCSGLCKTEPNFVCDEMGCRSTIQCGDGETAPGEVCDDGGTEAGDGCAADCLSIETGWDCPVDGGVCTERDPCFSLSPPLSCFPPAGTTPFCGDGTMNLSWEACDDGNPRAGDGCNGACKIEPNWSCTASGCTSTVICGDGVVSGGEVCDDGPVGAGCNADCFSVTPGYSCPPAGGVCVQVDPCDTPNPPASCDPGGGNPPPTPIYCGDGIKNGTDVCDDGNTAPGDGCNGACKVEPNFTCTGSPKSVCTSTFKCPNGKREGNEVCDDNNNVNGDGCSNSCTKLDPFFTCPAGGGACTSTVVCNDSRITGNETCDDGNKTNNDGCSSTCQLETGYFCPTVGQPCQKVPYCGDGKQTPNEECDDGDTGSGDGCSSTCKLEAGFACPTPGQACTAFSISCGDGKLGGAEQCDDNNKTAGDGCSATCQVEDGFQCSAAGQACTTLCGDGKVRGQELCDDGNKNNNDGCSSSCTWEPGFSCNASPPHACAVDYCGNSKVGNDEACDDGNGRPFDGCAPDCTIEPSCAYGASGCSSACGDGLVINEECDDGNTRSGDGCSSTCKRETGFTCNQPTACAEKLPWDHDRNPSTAGIQTCVQRIPVLYRDFNANHVDFEPGVNSIKITGLVQNTLTNGRPVYQGPINQCGTNQPCVTSVSSFGEWFRDVNGKNAAVVGELLLWDRDRSTGGGAYNPNVADVSFVNRWGAEGQKWAITQAAQPTGADCGNKWACSEGASGSSNCACSGSTGWNNLCNLPAGYECRYYTEGWVETPFGGGNIAYWKAVSTSQGGNDPTVTEYEGDPTFFPLDGMPGVLSDTRHNAAIAPYYGGNWDAESNYVTNPGTHNFHFTSEIRRWFKYETGKNYTLNFTGDDDVWVFINGRLAVDIGSFHPPENGSITISNANAATYNLTNGNVYEIAMFQAERKVAGSTYYLTLSGFNFNPSVCSSTCGDGVKASNEICEPALNPDCLANCTLGAYCGDGTKSATEGCDNGVNLSGYNDRTATSCGPGCKKPAYCGNSTVDYAFSEVCDNGGANNNTAYGGCTTACQLGPHCGDGQQNGTEECDDGVNDGNGGCGPGCVSTTACGNGRIDTGEECDDGVNDGGYGECASNCQWAPFCGDGDLNTASGEACDDGVLAGGYGGCNEACQLGPRCGDGVKNGTEVCDDGVNNGAYGTCGVGCTAPPRCGDNRKDSPQEQCDDGVNDGTKTACIAGCVLGPYCGDGTRDVGEACDDGSNLGGYNKCAPGCVWGPRCGDAQTQAPTEECDDGVNSGAYGSCAPNCQLGPYCGDGQKNGVETCDDGVNSGAYGRCTPDCKVGPYCGDNILQPEEQCDDGVNDGTKTSCQPGCVFGPGCGDGVLQEGEACDLGNQNSYSYGGCRPDNCTFGPRCGDAAKQSPQEQCDDGVNPGGYGQCAQNCRLGPYCGDGVVNGSEICDDGVNDGGYGECAAACKLGPYCGDGKVHAANEGCDDGNRKNGDGCSASCKVEGVVK